MHAYKEPTFISNILIVDDDDSIRLLFIKKLEELGYKTFGASNSNEAMQLIERTSFSLILLDQQLKSELGTDLLSTFLQKDPFTKIVFLTSHESIKLAIETMKLGASSFLVKSDPIDENIAHIMNLLDNEKAYKDDCFFPSSNIIGRSEPIRSALSKALKVKNSNSTILLTGESGVGKEMFAKFIHQVSDRKNNPFIAINCAAISESLLEAELFGFRKGAFTDAKLDRKGFFETCSDGTLLLDEIGETSPCLQAKLLRVLQEREVTPVGSCHPIKVNTRVIAATNRDLQKEVHEKRFREDLYYRLAVIHIEIPTLRDRVDDIPLLVDSFLKQFNKRFNKSVHSPSNEVLSRLKAYPWPGNIRELYNAIERGVLLSENNELAVEDLLPQKSRSQSTPALDTAKLPFDYSKAKDIFEKNYIENLLKNTNYNVTDAAKISNQYRTNIYRLIKKHNIAIDRKNTVETS